MGDYRRVRLKRFAPLEERETPEARFWRKFKRPVIQQLLAPATSIDFNPVAPHDFAVTAGARVLIFDAKSSLEKRALSKFKDAVYSGTFRPDGRLLCAGTARGAVHVVDIATRSTLRTFRGHRGPVHVAHFGAPTQLLSAGDDTSVRFWDMTSGAALSVLEHAHSDYVRCAHYGGAAAGAPHLWATGSYDHTVRLWDTRLLGRRGRAAAEAPAPAAASTLVARDGDDDDNDGGASDAGAAGAAEEAAAAASDRAADIGGESASGSEGDDGAEASDDDDSHGDDVDEDDEGEEEESDGAADDAAGGAAAKRPSNDAADAPADARRTAGGHRGCVLAVDHGEPVSRALLMPGGTTLLTAGGASLKLWDLAAGGRLLLSTTPHQKMITSLALDGSSTRVLTGGLDGLLKVHELGSLGVLATTRYDAPIVCLAVSPDNTRLVVGTGDGALCSKSRQLSHAQVVAEAKTARVLRGGSYRYFLRGQATAAAEDDIKVAAGRKQHLQPFDAALRAFAYGAALDAALAAHSPLVVASLLEELVARGPAALRAALAGRDEDALEPTLAFLCRHVADPRYAPLLLDVTNVVLDMYAPIVGQSAAVDARFASLARRLGDEVALSSELLRLQGQLDALMAASATAGRG